MATINASNGVSYHLFGLLDQSATGGRGSVTEPTEKIKINTLNNDLSNGYFSRALFGSAAGLRTFVLKLPTLIHYSVAPLTLTGINGDTLSREQYIWELYCENQVSGTPFVIQSSRNGQYYLVQFVDEELSYDRMLVKLYSTGITLQQVRMSGVTVCDPSTIIDPGGCGRWFKGDTAFSGGNWASSIAGGIVQVVTGDVTEVSANVNGHAIKRFNSSALSGYVKQSIDGSTVCEVIMVIKIRETTNFSNAAGIFTDRAGASQGLIGSSGTTKFANPSLSASLFTYRLNGLAYAQSNMQAPINTWGIVHIRYLTGWSAVNGIQFGRDGTTAGTYAKMDVAEIVIPSSAMVFPASVAREITEYLAVKYAITI